MYNAPISLVIFFAAKVAQNRALVRRANLREHQTGVKPLARSAQMALDQVNMDYEGFVGNWTLETKYQRPRFPTLSVDKALLAKSRTAHNLSHFVDMDNG